MAGGYGKRGERSDVQAFFISIGARYKRIRKRPGGIPSPQLCDYRYGKLQKLEQKARDGHIALYYADESQVCTGGYVPCGCQLPGEQVCVPSQRTARLNLFRMIDRKNHYAGFSSAESITADKVVGFLDTFSFHVRKDTFVVLDSATAHRNHKIRECGLSGKKEVSSFSIRPRILLIRTLWKHS
jgi:hypothetical protein